MPPTRDHGSSVIKGCASNQGALLLLHAQYSSVLEGRIASKVKTRS